MKLTIFIFEQVPLTDFLIPYDVLRDIPGIEITIASYLDTEIITAGHDVSVCGVTHVDMIEATDALWICGSHNIQSVISQKSVYETSLRRLIDSSKSVIAIAEGVLVLAHLGVLQQVHVTCPRQMCGQVKKAGAIIKKELTVIDGKFITVESHGHNFDLAFTVSQLLMDTEEDSDLKSEWSFEPNYLYKSESLPKNGLQASLLNKRLQKAWRLNEKYKSDDVKKGHTKYEPGSMHGVFDITFYLFNQMRAIDIAITYELFRHFPKVRTRCVSDKRGVIEVEGNGFKLITKHAIQDVTKTQMLVIGGGEDGIVNELNQGYLLHWLERICENAQRVLTVGDGVRYLGVSGILTRYENYIDWYQPKAMGKYIVAQTLTNAIDAILLLAKQNHGDKLAKALQRFIAYGYIQND